MDEDDSTMNTNDIKNFLDSHIDSGVDLIYHYGDSKSKVEACNANMDNEHADAILLISDDMTLKLVNYDDVIEVQYPNNE